MRNILSAEGRAPLWTTRLALALLLAMPLSAAMGQPGRDTRSDSGAPSGSPPSEVSPNSPRAAVTAYLELARAGRYLEAAAYLVMPDSVSPDGRATMARRLKAVLDHHAWLDLEAISPAAEGDTTDGLAPDAEQIANVPGRDGSRQPVRLVRSDSTVWRFAPATVARVSGWYGALPDRWILDHVPAVLLLPGPFDVLWWQWLALPALVLLAGTIGSLASRLVRRALTRVASRTPGDWDDALLGRLGGPILVACWLAAAAAMIPVISLSPPAASLAYRLIRAGASLAIFWSLWRAIDVTHGLIMRTSWATSAASSRSLVPLGARVAKVAVVAIGIVVGLSMLGFPVASLLAGLGIGGLAFALAAQKTVENLFGAFAIGIDQPFREGDFVKVDDFVGTVEAIGVRSTQFRTLDRTLISIPNGHLAEIRLESFAARDRLRLATVIGLVYETTAAQMRTVLSGFERVLRGHPKFWPGAVVVRFKEFASSSLDIEIMAWFETADWGEFQLIRQEILLQFMDVVESAGSSFAFPTQTVHLAPAPAGNGSPEAGVARG